MRMKKTIFIIVTLIATVSCSKSADAPASMQEWTFEAAYTKASLSTQGAFSWEKNDRIAVWNATAGSFVSFTSLTGKGIFNATAPSDAHFAAAAFYPSDIPVSTSGISLPAVYSSPQEAERVFPMFAEVQDGSKTLSFKHLGALANFTFIRFSPEADHLEISSPGKKLSGTFQMATNSSSLKEIQVSEGSGSISVAFTPGESVLSVTVPLPAGSYPLTVKLLKGGETLLEIVGNDTHGFERAVLSRFKTIDVNPVDEIPFQLVQTESYSLEGDDELWM